MLGANPDWRVAGREWPDGLHRIRLSAAGGGYRGTARLQAEEFEIEARDGSLTFAAGSLSSLLAAVSGWLEQQGCRWLYPGKEGEVVPTRRGLRSPAGRSRSRADLAMRGLFPVENIQRYTPGDVTGTLDWMAKNRFNYLVVLFNHASGRTLPTLFAESRLRGIQLAGYIWSFELFLPLELGKAHPEHFAMVDGKRTIDYNIKRCASSAEGIRLYVENGVRFFRSHPEIRTWNVIPNDGFHWCSCGSCRNLRPKDQWARFFVPLVERMAREQPEVRLQNFIYVQRFDLSENIASYRSPALDHFFDVFWRNKWYELRDPAMPASRHREEESDERSRGMSINAYLADRLKAWRESVPGRIWVFEDVMLHATCSFPLPNIQVIGADLRAARAEKLQGYLFESYLQGWNSFASDLWSLGRMAWGAGGDPVAIEREFCRALLGGQSAPMERFLDGFRSRYLSSAPTPRAAPAASPRCDTLVRHQLFHAPLVHQLRVALRFFQRLPHRRRVALIGRLQRHRHNRPARQVHRVLGLVRQVRPAVLHLRDARVRICRAHPLLVRRLLLPLAIQPRQLLPRRLLHASGRRQPLQVLFVFAPVVAPPNRPHRRVRLQRRRVDRDRLPAQHARLPQHLHQPTEHCLVRFHAQQPPRPRQRRMVRRLLRHPVSQELPQRQRVSHAPGDPPLGINPLHVAHQQRPEVRPPRDARTAHDRLVVPPAQLLRLLVEAVFVQDLVHLGVEGMRGRLGDLFRAHPQPLLLRFASAHGHDYKDVRNVLGVTCFDGLLPRAASTTGS
jgi:hypothetical protein